MSQSPHSDLGIIRSIHRCEVFCSVCKIGAGELPFPIAAAEAELKAAHWKKIENRWTCPFCVLERKSDESQANSRPHR